MSFRSFAFAGSVLVNFVAACGTDSTLTLHPVDNSEESELTDERKAGGPQLSRRTMARIRQAYSHLKGRGVLTEQAWQANKELPSSVPYEAFELEDDAENGISDGYAFTAIVPVDTAAADDAEPKQFYIERMGGYAGWCYLAGPFDLAR